MDGSSYFTEDPVLGAMPGPSALVGAPTFTLESPLGGNVEQPVGPILPIVTKLMTQIPSPTHASLPPKLVQKILNLEFIEMAELVPESWGIDPEPAVCCHQGRRQARRGPVTDILLWLECYSALVAVLASKYPQRIGDFMSYQATIIKAHRNFEGMSWVVYDRCYRRRAAATKSLEWAKIDTALYNEAFTGRARSVPRCNYCLSLDHSDHDCPACPMPVGEQPTGKVFPIGGGTPRPPRALQYRTAVGGPPALQEICQLFNSARCRMVWCKRRHVCNLCGLPHPELLCQRRVEKRGRSRSPRRGMGARPT